MATHKHHDHAPCDCEKLKNAEREELKSGLQRCSEEREAERQRRVHEAVTRADESDTELKSIKKKLLAFQLVTVIAATLLGEEWVERLMTKVDTLKGVHEKITAPVKPDPAKPVTLIDPKRDPLNNFARPWFPRPEARDVAIKGNGDISGIFAGSKPQNPVDEPLPEPTPIQPSLAAEIARAAVATDIPALVLPYTPVTDPYAFFLTPSAIPFDIYSTGLGLGNNYGFGEYYGAGTGGSVGPTTPSPSPLAVFAMGGLMHSRKRA
jgi:hypothetical protein